MKQLAFALAIAAAVAAAAPEAGAQGRGSKAGRVPPGHRPPAGMCRVWIDGVPPGQQSAPTDCATAEANRPANGRVIYGAQPGSDDDKRKGKAKGKGKDKRGDDDDRGRRRGGDDDDDGDDDDRWDDDRRRRGDNICYDRDRNGVCDTAEQRTGGGDSCIDRNRDGRCDVALPAGGYPSTLPDMVRVIVLREGARSDEMSRWLGGASGVQGRYVDADSNGVPERISWVNASGTLLQLWSDRDRDGKADLVQIYENGRRVRAIRR